MMSERGGEWRGGFEIFCNERVLEENIIVLFQNLTECGESSPLN